jgi:demethylmenaquinone methyltransferase/2-methoxy-6-polyprenyl-1,4-benzoquinol methylase
LDRGWREWAARSIDAEGPWLDLASGTGDLAAHLYRRRHLARSRPVLIRSDLVPALLPAGSTKLEKLSAKSPRRGSGKPEGTAVFQESGPTDESPGLGCEMDALPFADGSLGAIVQGFALRHCRDYSGFFAELHRVLRRGGQIAILDMRYPRGAGSAFYRFYFRAVLPRLAAFLGGDREAYRFLVHSVRSMPEESWLIEALRNAGFEEVESRPGFLGSVRLLVARKPGALAGSDRSAYSPQTSTIQPGA